MNTEADSQPSKNVLGVSASLAAIVVFSFVDIAVAYLSRGRYPISQVMFFRSVFAVPLTFIFLVYDGNVAKLRTSRPLLHLVRCIIGSATMYLIFKSLSLLDVATVESLWSTSPIIVTVISYFFLREAVGPQRWAAVAIGFVGVLIISPPQSFELATAVPISAAVLAAIVVVLVRILGKTEPAAVTAFFFVVASSIFSLFLAIGDTWVMPDLTGWLVFFATAALATAGQLLSTQAFRWAEASLIMPIRYLGIVLAAILAFLFYGEVPTWQTIAGASLIVAAGLFTIYREVRVSRREAAATAQSGSVDRSRF